MLKRFLISFCVALIICGGVHKVHSQQLRVAQREAEWNDYVLPQSNFERQTDPEKALIIRVPGDWQRQFSEHLEYSGPNGSSLKVVVDKIPNGAPLQSYVSALMQSLRAIANSPDSILMRTTTMAGLEAREISFESSEGSIEVTKRIIWSTVRGESALSIILIAPIDKISEIEPYFKAVVQSVILVNKSLYSAFDELRKPAVKEFKPQRVDAVQALVASLTSLGDSNRQQNIARLATLFSSAPDSVIDLALDNRPMVRAAVVEAMAQSGNNSLEKFLITALNDRELFVSQQAVKSVAVKPNVVDLLRDHSFDWFNTEPLVRVWPFLERKSQIEILTEMFAPSNELETSSKALTTKIPRPRNVSSRAKVAPPGLPPPPVKNPPRRGVPERPTTLPPGLPATGVTITLDGATLMSPTPDPSRCLTGLTLLTDLPVSAFKMPLDLILARKNDSLTALALVVAWRREEILPATELLKLLSSTSNEYVRRLCALHLGQSAGMNDITAIEDYAAKSATGRIEAPNTAASNTATNALNDVLQLTITKIRFRHELLTATPEIRQQLIQKNLDDPKLAEWVWYRYVRGKVAQESRTSTVGTVKALPLGQNLFPMDITYYAALPRPALVLEKLNGAIDGLQLDSARSQASLVLVLSNLREQLGEALDSPRGARHLLYSGIDINEPIAAAKWFAAGAPKGVKSAERKAIILRVTDRARFERLLTLHRQSTTRFTELVDSFGASVRFLPILPAFLPVTAKAILEGSINPPTKKTPLLSYKFMGTTEWHGHSIKVVEQRRVEDDGALTTDPTFLTYLGDTAVLAPDMASLQDVLDRATSERDTLADNPDFKRTASASAEAIYFSDLRQVAAVAPVSNNLTKTAAIESGALRISNSAFENVFDIRFAASDWLQPFEYFDADQLVSPQQLLPQSTVAYYFMKFNSVSAWRDWVPQLLSAEEQEELRSVWAIDFEKEVLPELGPECGAAVLDLPNILAENWELSWVVFFKLRSDKLARAFEARKLVSGGSAGTGPAQLKLKSGDFFVAVKEGFLVLSKSRKSIAALDQKEKLISSRDFLQATKRAPSDLAAFGGYNVESAIAAIGSSPGDAVKAEISSVVASLANAFHSPTFYAKATANSVQANLSLSLGQEGRYSVSELSSLSNRQAYGEVEARGLPIHDQQRLKSLKLRVKAKADGEIDRIKADVTSPYQVIEKLGDKEVELRVFPRNNTPKTTLVLPVIDPQFDQYLKPDREIRADDPMVASKAREIVGEERDAWSAARKLGEWTYKNLTWKRVDFATAPQTLATREADCLEFSQLYVAMARSLGLPARIVSGLAHSGGSFGAHAWVEVYVGSWVEIDPTWGTDFVDATHIRNSPNGTLLMYAALKLMELEVLEVPRGVPDFQKDVRLLAEKLCRELVKDDAQVLTSALDLALLINEDSALGAWDSLTNSERDLVSSAYNKILLSIHAELGSEVAKDNALRLLRVVENGDTAEALAVPTQGFDRSLVKFRFLKKNDAWFLRELIHADTDYHIVSEAFQPTIRALVARRKQTQVQSFGGSEVGRILVVMQKDAKGALAIVDRALKEDANSQGLRHLKAMVLIRNDRKTEAIDLWKQLAAGDKPFAPAMLNLAWQHDSTDETQRKLAIEFYTRYAEIEPADPRSHIALARLYEASGNEAQAEAEHRAALKADSLNTRQYVEFAVFLATRKRFKEVDSLMTEAESKAGPEDDLFADLIFDLTIREKDNVSEELARLQSQRMGKSARANLYLGYELIEKGKNIQALTLLKKAATLKQQWSDPYTAMARAYRALRNWRDALAATDAAIGLDPEDSDAHYNRACVLVKLGRIKEALTALEKCVNLDPYQVDSIKEEADLKVLASRPAFKKILEAGEAQQ